MEKFKVGYIQGHKLWAIDDQMTPEERQMHEKLDRMVDITKPLVPQVRAMTNKEFMAFVSKPRHVDDTDCIIFYEDEKLEYYYKWRLDYANNCKMLIPLVTLYLGLAYYLSMDTLEFAKHFLMFFLGGLAFGWTTSEYIYHRFYLHRECELDPEGKADPDLLETLFVTHLHHHVFMNQWIRIGTSVDLVFYMTIPMQTILHFVLPHTSALLFTAAMVAGGMIEDTIHISYHKNDANSWFRFIPNYTRTRDAHMRHHFRDNSKEFGVTTDLFDYMIGTTNLPPKAKQN